MVEKLEMIRDQTNKSAGPSMSRDNAIFEENLIHSGAQSPLLANIKDKMLYNGGFNNV